MEERKGRVKITELSSENCEPCKELQEAVEKLSSEYDIDFIVVDLDPEDTAKEKEAVFGETDVFPTTIIESGGRSTKLQGFSEETLRAAIKEVLDAK